VRRVGLSIFLLLLATVSAGCAGLVSGSSGAGGTQSTLVVTNVQSATVTTASSQVTWITNVPANSSVDFGTTAAFGNTSPVDSGMVTSHQVTLTGLAAGTTYYYQVNSTDANGHHGHGGNGFKTLGYSLSGTISPSTGGSGATVTLTGAANATATANSSGAYTFAGLASGTYTVTPSNAGYTFAPVNQNVTVGTANITGVNFTDNVAATGPTITTQPTNQTVTAGQTATFTVVASGTAPLSYQWQKNGANIAGATTASYTTPVTTTAASGSTFDVVVSNTAGSVTSTAVTLTVTAAAVAPTITTQPTNQTVTAGQTANFTVLAAGTAPLSYQWLKNNANISGATTSSYTTPATISSDNGTQFTVVVSNSAGSVTSSAAPLTVNAAAVAPTITTQPASQAVTAGQTATFTVVATGTAPLAYQWQKNGANISGATTASYTTPVTTTADSGSTFRVVVTNTAGTATSSAATLTVNTAAVAPTITTQPVNQTVTAGQTASFTVVATGTAPLAYQWQKNSANITGATATSYTTPVTTTADSGSTFRVVVTNTAGSVTSSTAKLTVNATTPPTVSISSPANGATVSGTISVSGSASDALGVSSVQVQVDSGAFSSASGTTSWTFSLDTTSLSNAAHTLTARATNTSGLTASSTISVNVSNSSGGGTIINVTSFGATGNGSTDDTAAINSAIAALSSGDTLLFPCGSYKTSSQLSLILSNVTVDGSSCAVILNTSSGTVMVIGGSGNGNPNYGPAIALSSTANELATSFSTTSSLGVSPGDYLLLQQGGKDSSTGSSDTGCDPSGCRGELLKVASVSGNSITVTTALHDTYNPSLNAATAQKIINPLSAITVKNITFDGNGSNVYGLALAGVADSSVSGVSSRNVQGAALLNRADFNVSWTNISVSGAGSAQCGSSVWFEKQGNLSINGLSISNENQGASGSGCLDNGAFGFELQASANSTITNLSVDASGAYGRPFKTSAARYNTFNSPIVKNGVQAYNGISLEYYSSHNTYNNCTVTNNGAGTGTGTGNAGIITFGNFNQYNSFNNCTVSGNGNVQFYISGYDALRLAADSHNTISGGSFTGSNNVEAPILIEGDGMYITGATISGPGAQGIYLDSQASNACVNNNTFLGGSNLGSAISANGSNDLGLGNLFNLLGSNLSAGSCSATLP